jgi:hypothetical protein
MPTKAMNAIFVEAQVRRQSRRSHGSGFVRSQNFRFFCLINGKLRGSSNFLEISLMRQSGFPDNSFFKGIFSNYLEVDFIDRLRV